MSLLSNFFHHFVFFVKQKTAYEMRISDWSSDVCSSDLSQATTPCVATAFHWKGRQACWAIKAGGWQFWHWWHRHVSRRPMRRLRLRTVAATARSPPWTRGWWLPPVPRARRTARQRRFPYSTDRKSVVLGMSVSVRSDLADRRTINTRNSNSIK